MMRRLLWLLACLGALLVYDLFNTGYLPWLIDWLRGR